MANKQKSVLFLDRDGVINLRPQGYVTKRREFLWLPNVIKGVQKLRPYFDKLVVVTNQQCVGKGILDTKLLSKIQERMMCVFASQGVKVDMVLSATSLAHIPYNSRKPSDAMVLKMKEIFGFDIVKKHSMMVGDELGDMRFAQKLDIPKAWIINPKADYSKIIDTSPEYQVRDLMDLYNQMILQN